MRVLASLDESSDTPCEVFRDLSMGDHPVVWSRCPGRGRMFYSALGHTAASHQRPEQQRMLEGAIAWAAGLAGDCPEPR